MMQSSHIKENSPVQKVDHPLLQEYRVNLMMKRDDMIHPQISGNKWRKLKYNLETADAENHNTILTFGGAFSNHIVATAVCSSLMGLRSIGVIRGEAAYATNPTLSLAADYGMQLHFVSREDYRRKEHPDYVDALSQKLGRFYMIPEGGANKLGRLGCAEILESVNMSYQYVAVAIGTGTTFLGLLDSLGARRRLIGFPVLKGFDELDDYLEDQYDAQQYQLMKDYHFGGYAKFNHQLITFINDFKRMTTIALDPIYTGKMMYGLFDMIKQGCFPEDSELLAIHTGGLQGIKGFNLMNGDLIDG